MKFLAFFFLGLGLLLYNASCEKDSEIPDDVMQPELNFSMNCDQDSVFYVYGPDFYKIFLTLSNYCVTIRFSDTVTQDYLDSLIERNVEIDSICVYDEDKNIYYGYLKNGCNCEKISVLLKNLYSESKILCANPNYYFTETIAKGNPIDNRYDLIGIYDEFYVALKPGLLTSKLNSVVAKTNTKIAEAHGTYFVISADKNSDFNSLEMSRYFYETGYFEYSHPVFLMSAVAFK